MSRMRRAARSLASGYAAIIANAGYALASVPLALHYLSKDEFGLWALVTQIGSYLLLLDLGMSSSVSRNLMDHKDHQEDGMYGSTILTGLLTGFVQGLCVAVGGVLLSFWLPGLLEVPGQYVNIFRLLVSGQCVLLGVFFVGRSMSGLLEAHQRYDISNYTQILQLGAGFGTQWLTFHWGWGLYSLLAATAVSALCGFSNNLVGVVRLGLFPARGYWGRPTWGLFLEVFGYANNLFLLMVGNQLLNASQVVIVSRTQGLAAAAVWSIATRTFQLAFQFVQRIFDFSGPALAEMIVRGERETLRRRFREVLLLTASAVVFLATAVAVCNGSFLAIWTKKLVAWPWWNDALMGILLVLNCISRCFVGLSGYAKEIRTMRWIYFLEGATFVIAAFLVAPKFGMAGIIFVAIFAKLTWSGLYGVRWGSSYLGASFSEVLLGWLGAAWRYLMVMAPFAALLSWVSFSWPAGIRFVVDGMVMAVVGLILFWFMGVSPGLRLELKGFIWKGRSEKAQTVEANSLTLVK